MPKQQQQEQKENERKEEEAKEAITRKRRVLVIDDEKDITYVFKMGLESNGFEVDAYTVPFEALSNFKVGYYNIIISDIRMPGMSGFELCSKLIEMDDKVKVFFVSGFVMYSDEMTLQYPNMNMINYKQFIDKPVSINKLVKAIAVE